MKKVDFQFTFGHKSVKRTELVIIIIEFITNIFRVLALTIISFKNPSCEFKSYIVRTVMFCEGYIVRGFVGAISMFRLVDFQDFLHGVRTRMKKTSPEERQHTPSSCTHGVY